MATGYIHCDPVIIPLFLLNRVLFLYLCFHPDISKNVQKLVLFSLYQGIWGLQHTVKSAIQPLVFKHVIDVRCYVTNVADYYAYCFNQLRLDMMEKVMRDYTRRIPKLRGLSYHERLSMLMMNSQKKIPINASESQ